jgi:hypothetical protein
MLRVWLRASQLGLRLHPMTAAMDHADTRLTLAQAFGIRVDDTPVLCFRLGYADVGAHSARLPLDAIVA